VRRRHGVLVVTVLLALAVAPACTHAGPAPGGVVSSGSSTIHVTAAGDYGSTPATAAVLDAVAAAAPDVHLALGDLSYGRTGDEESWCRFVHDHVGSLPFELVPGNHESDGLNGSIDAFARCLPNWLPGRVEAYPREWYADLPQERPVARFVMISPALHFSDGTWSYDVVTAHYAWTEEAIRGARAADIPWVVVGMHEGCLSVGRYPCTVGTDLTELFLSEHVDLVLTGHEHLYQRTLQLALGPGCAHLRPGRFDAACVVDDRDSLSGGAGTVFVTAGTGGVPLRDVAMDDPEARYFAAWSGANDDPAHGYLDLRATDSALTLAFVRVPDGTVVDRVTLTRRPTG
jgi:hypothetical protein